MAGFRLEISRAALVIADPQVAVVEDGATSPTRSGAPTRQIEMEWRAFGPTKFRVPVIGQGPWHLEEDDRRLAGRRDDVFLVSKVLPQHATRQGTIDLDAVPEPSRRCR
jgi:hypothetical protein